MEKDPWQRRKRSKNTNWYIRRDWQKCCIYITEIGSLKINKKTRKICLYKNIITEIKFKGRVGGYSWGNIKESSTKRLKYVKWDRKKYNT